jgi:hypothetical protein
VPLKADLALRICRKFIISEEWLATGRLTLIEKAGKLHGVEPHPSLRRIYVRMCMDLASAPEATQFHHGILFSEAYDTKLAKVFEERIKRHYYGIGIPAAVWKDSDIELGLDILRVLIERSLLLIANEALRRETSKEHAMATYLGFLIRMSLFGFGKCLANEVDVTKYGLPVELFSDKTVPISAFKKAEVIRSEAEAIRGEAEHVPLSFGAP